MLLSEANLYAAQVFALVTGILGGWLLVADAAAAWQAPKAPIRIAPFPIRGRRSAAAPFCRRVERRPATDSVSEIESKTPLASAIHSCSLWTAACRSPRGTASRFRYCSLAWTTIRPRRPARTAHGQGVAGGGGTLHVVSALDGLGRPLRGDDVRVFVARRRSRPGLDGGGAGCGGTFPARPCRRDPHRRGFLEHRRHGHRAGDGGTSIVQRAEEALSPAMRDGGDCIRSRLGNRTGTSVGIATKYVCAITSGGLRGAHITAHSVVCDVNHCGDRAALLHIGSSVRKIRRLVDESPCDCLTRPSFFVYAHARFVRCHPSHRHATVICSTSTLGGSPRCDSVFRNTGRQCQELAASAKDCMMRQDSAYARSAGSSSASRMAVMPTGPTISLRAGSSPACLKRGGDASVGRSAL